MEAVRVSLPTGKATGDRMETTGKGGVKGLGVNHCMLPCRATGTGRYHCL